MYVSLQLHREGRSAGGPAAWLQPRGELIVPHEAGHHGACRGCAAAEALPGWQQHSHTLPSAQHPPTRVTLVALLLGCLEAEHHPFLTELSSMARACGGALCDIFTNWHSRRNGLPST